MEKQVVRVGPLANVITVSGQVSVDGRGQAVEEGDVTVQVGHAYANTANTANTAKILDAVDATVN